MKVKVTVEYEVEPKMLEVGQCGSTDFPSVQGVLNKERWRFRDVLQPLNLENSIFKIEEIK